MADSAGRANEERPEVNDLDESEVATERPARRIPFWLLLIPAVLISAGTGGYLAYAYYGDITTQLSLSGQASDMAEEDRPRKYGEFAEIENVIINPASSGGQRYLMVTIGLEARNSATLDEVRRREIVVRDTMLKLLGNMTVDELADVSRRDELKESLRSAVNRILSDGKVDYLYFTRFVLQ